MSPLRRYLQISSRSVLEVRIYLDNPADLSRWLLSARDPMLGRIMEAVRPLVVPKLKEENDRAKGRGKGAKKKGVRDVVVTDDFEVSIFLTELSSRHSILKKHKTFLGKGGKIKSNSAKLTGTREEPVDVEEEEEANGENLVRQESTEDGDGSLGLNSIPAARHGDATKAISRDEGPADDDSLFISEESEESEMEPPRTPHGKKTSAPPTQTEVQDTEPEEDEKKKSAFTTTYDGYGIHNRILCLVVKRKGQKSKPAVGGTGQVMMEDWITSTQAIEQGGGGMMDD